MAEWEGAYAIPGKPFTISAMMLTILTPSSRHGTLGEREREREREEGREGGAFYNLSM